jgi:hypothetical protein
MRRRPLLAACLSLALAAAGVGTVSAAAPAPAFSVTLTDDGTCQLSATASWSHTKATEVDFVWTFGIATWQDNVTAVRGRRAVDSFTAGASSSTRTWTVIAYVYLDGALVGQSSDSVPMPCGLLL